MAPTDRRLQWRHWHDELCSQFPEVRKLEAEQWPTRLAIAVEDIFDQSRPEPERLVNAEQAVLSHYTEGISAEEREQIEECLAEAVRLQVQDDFEQWKTDASAG